uniref:Reverse transcriptase domain-containing protein n=1 Tax=Fagus sylvatica TaxID=28930 RepID=A0A2N9F9V4_FAGSY
MSGVPSSSRHSRCVVHRESKISAQKVSSETSFKPSWHIEVSYKPSEEATAGRASIVASSQHTDPNDRSFGRTDQWATSKELGSYNSGRGNARFGLNYSSTASQAEDSERIISELRREIRDLKSLTPRPVPRKPLELGEHSRSRLPLHSGRGLQTKEHTSRKTARPGGQHVVWKALDLVSSSPFSRQIERAELPERYTAPRFETYNGRTDPVAHIGRYQQSMALSRYNDPLMCRIFPSSLGEVALRCWKTREMDALLTMKLQDNETIKEYSTQFWETYNDIDGCDEEVAVRTFKLGLPPGTGLRQSLTKRPASTVGKLMHRIDQFIRVEEDVFKEPIYKLMEKIKREPFFVWPLKLLGKLDLRDRKLYCTYHKDMGHLTENCHKLKVHLEQLASAGHLDQYIDTNLTIRKEASQMVQQPDSSGVASAGVIHVIHNPRCSTVSPKFYRSEIKKAEHLRRSFSITDSIHPALMCSVNGGAREQTISFSDSDLKDVQLPHNDPLIITLRIGNYDVQRVLIDQGSFAEVMYQDLYTKLGLGEAELTSFISPIFGFLGEPTVSLGKIVLPILDNSLHLSSEAKIPNKRGDHGVEWGSGRSKTLQEPEDGEVVMTEQPEKVFFDPSNPELFFLVGSKLSAVDKEQLLQLLMNNREVFAWSVYDASGVSPDFACHTLNIGPKHKLVAQKRQKLAPERATIVLEEVERLLASRTIREVQYPRWLSNTVVVKKKNGKWRVCIDFTDLNKACPKDPFPLPRIDQLVDSALGLARLSFLDTFQGYHQIPMSVADQEKTSLITPKGAYCYKIVEVYIDDMLIKSLREEDHVANLLQVFDILRRSRLRLNASKCTFGVSSGKFLGRVVSRKGIEANPDQIAALVDLAEPRNIKQDEECSAAFQGIKAYLSTPPCLSIPNSREPLFLYLVVSDHAARDERMSAYLSVARSLLAEFDSTHVVQIGKEHNSHADILAKLATVLESDVQRTVCIETLDRPSFQKQEVSVCSISNQPSWMDPILSYLMDNKLPEDKKEAKMIKRKAPRYWVFKEGLLYRRSFTGPYLLCVHPEMANALKYIWECDKCQRFAPMIHQPARELNPLSSPWPFAQWGLDILGPLPWAPGNKRQAEVSNKVILSGIKRKLELAKEKWVEELPSVLWTHKTTVRKSTRETPFALAFGVEAVIPLEVGMPTTRTTEFIVETNEDNLRKDLDLLEERRDLAVVRLASYQQRIRREHNKNIKPRVLRIGDLVLRKVMANTRKSNDGKLGPNWEGPYKVLSQAGIGAFRLEDMDGKPVPRPWNICNLRKYFF